MSLKKIAFLTPRGGMTDKEFRTYWRETHGPLVAGSPGYDVWRLRYVQNHVCERGPIGKPFEFSGIAAFWLPGTSPNEDIYAQTPIYRDRIRVDELNFIEMDRTVSLSAHERVLKEGRGVVKVIIVSSRAESLSPESFEKFYLQDYALPALEGIETGSLIAGWSVNFTIPGTFRLPGARSVDEYAIDCVEELWFASRANADATFRPPAMTATGLFGERQSFHAEEIIFFDVAQGGAL